MSPHIPRPHIRTRYHGFSFKTSFEPQDTVDPSEKLISSHEGGRNKIISIGQNVQLSKSVETSGTGVAAFAPSVKHAITNICIPRTDNLSPHRPLTFRYVSILPRPICPDGHTRYLGVIMPQFVFSPSRFSGARFGRQRGDCTSPG